MGKDKRRLTTGHRHFWIPNLDFLSAFFAFWFGATFDEMTPRPAPVRIPTRKN